MDNKGPLILTFYLGIFFQELGEKLPYTLRMIAGCNEECGMDGVEYYIHHYEEPVFLFTPDSEFPLCNGEKGRLCANFTSKHFEQGAILEFQGGVIADYLIRYDLVSEDEKRYLSMVSLLCGDHLGRGLGIQCDDGIFPP